MQNHKHVPLTYDSARVLDILQGYSLPKSGEVKTNACSVTEIVKISKVLNIGLPIKSILYFRMSAGIKGWIHKDINLSRPHFLTNHALNLPLANCEQVYMKWFTQNDLTINAMPFGGPTSGSPTPFLENNNATCIDTVNCNTVKLVNVNDWHSIENNSVEGHADLISIRFVSVVKTSMLLPISEWL
jgi:hypothetical protein